MLHTGKWLKFSSLRVVESNPKIWRRPVSIRSALVGVKYFRLVISCNMVGETSRAEFRFEDR
jgi:hypothetical protein